MIMLFKILFSLVMIKLLCLGEAEAKVRHSGRLLARPNPVKCSRRPRHLQEKSTGHNYFISEASNFKGHTANWLDARNLCREQCMDLISIESYGEYQMITDIVKQYNLHSLWTSGRLCNFKGCNKPHLLPKNINGWFWAGSGKTTGISPTNTIPRGWPAKPWSSSGYFGQFLQAGQQPQPDDAEFLLNGKLHEACLSVNNDWYGDGISFHDSACFIPMAFICEDSDALLRKARSLSPSVPIN